MVMNEIFLNFPKKLFINNEFHNPKNNKHFKCINPSNENIICEIIPDILVKGEDYKNKLIAGEKCMRDNGKKIELVKLLSGKSTTHIIDNIQKIKD